MKKARALPPSFDAPEGEGEGEEEPDDDESIGEETEERLSGERGGGCREEESEEEGEEESEEEGEESESESKEEHTLESGDSDFWEHARNEALRSRTRTTTRTLCAPPAPPLRDHSSHVQVLPHAQSKPAHKGSWPLTAGSLDWFAREVASSVTDYAGTRLPGDKTRRAPSLSHEHGRLPRAAYTGSPRMAISITSLCDGIWYSAMGSRLVYIESSGHGQSCGEVSSALSACD